MSCVSGSSRQVVLYAQYIGLLGSRLWCAGDEANAAAAAAAAGSLFRRYADQRLSSVSSGYVANTTVDACAVTCVSETQFECRSFSYDNRHKSCLLFTVNVADRDVRLLPATDVDLYDCESVCLSVCRPTVYLIPPAFLFLISAGT